MIKKDSNLKIKFVDNSMKLKLDNYNHNQYKTSIKIDLILITHELSKRSDLSKKQISNIILSYYNEFNQNFHKELKNLDHIVHLKSKLENDFAKFLKFHKQISV